MPRIRVRTTAVVLGVAALGAAQPAAADTMGGAPPAPAPKLSGVECRVECAGPAYARAGSTVRLRGRALAAVTQVTFLGRRAAGDEVDRGAAGRVRPPRAGHRARRRHRRPGDGGHRRRPDRHAGADAGCTSSGSSCTPSRPAPGPGIEIGVAGRKVFFDGERQPTVAFVLHDAQPVHAVVQVVRVSDGVVDPRVRPGRRRAGRAADGLLGRDGRRRRAARGALRLRDRRPPRRRHDGQLGPGAARPGPAGRGSAAAAGLVRAARPQVPDPRQARLRSPAPPRSAAAAAIRATTSSPSAGRRSSRRAAAWSR